VYGPHGRRDAGVGSDQRVNRGRNPKLGLLPAETRNANGPLPREANRTSDGIHSDIAAPNSSRNFSVND
jgi:hypothetical protein